MFNLNDVLQNAQNGNAINNLAQQFGISPDQAQAAVHALIPAVSTGLMQKAQSAGLGGIISALGDPAHQAAFSSPDAAQSPQTAQKGGDVVNDMFGSNHIVQQIAQQASGVTGIRPDLLAQMLPVVVSIAMGGIAKAAQNQGWGNSLTQWTNDAEQGASSGGQSGGIIGMIVGVLGSFFGGGSSSAPQSGTSGGQSAADNLIKMFQTGSLPAEISQSGLSNEIGKILGTDKS